MRKGIVISFMLTVLACTAAGAVSGDEARFVARFDRRFAELDSLIASPCCLPGLRLSAVDVPDAEYSQAVDDAVRSRISALRAQNGLEFGGQAYWRQGSTTSVDFDDDEVYYGYWGKVQVEARWNFLQSSLFRRAGKENVYRLEGQIDMLEHRRDIQKTAIRRQREAFIMERDALLGSALRELVANYALMQDAYVHLYDNDNILADKIMTVLRDRDDAERRISALTTDGGGLRLLPRIGADAITVDTLALFRSLRENQIDVQLLQARDGLVGQKAENSSWAEQARVSPFVRYSRYFRHDYPSSGVVNAGVTFSLPLNSVAKRSRAALEAERVQIELQIRDVQENLVADARKAIAGIARANRSIAVEAAHLESLRAYLSERSEAYAGYRGRYDFLARMNGYNMYLQSLTRLIQLKYDRDILVVDLQAMSCDVPVLDFLTIYADE